MRQLASPYFIFHGSYANFPSDVIPNGGQSWYLIVRATDDYKTERFRAVAELHEEVREYNGRGDKS